MFLYYRTKDRTSLGKKPVTTVKEFLYHGYNQILPPFSMRILPNVDLYDVVRAFDTTDDIGFLRRLLLIANLDTN